jgi:4-hydroxythreonine-4-phosphate dehydrogenase
MKEAVGRTPIRLAVTLGDPRGIGPEVMTRAALEVLGGLGPRPEFTFLGADDPAPGALAPGLETCRHLGVGPFDGTEKSAGVISVAALERAVSMALEGEADAIVTGPVSKPALHAAGARFPGQTEFLEERTGASPVGMLMAAASSMPGVPLRILLATTHLALRDVPAALTPGRLEDQIRLLHRSLGRDWGMARPTIALCALNPHASDGGLFGNEEATVMRPVVDRLRSEGMDVDGPFPADTVFQRLVRAEADAVVAPYHDVGMAVFKTLAFGSGVNVTLGLPFVRTSPDHGTAFDRAGTGTADPSSAIEAIRLALRISANRSETNTWT